MRTALDKGKLMAFMEEVGKAAQGPGSVYLVGGATALLLGVRDQTIDVDIKIDPEPKGVFEAIARIKNQLDINVELASPDQFLPALPGWRARSQHIARYGQVEFFHYDFYGQVLAKILRGHRQDLSDATALVLRGKIELTALVSLFGQIESDLIRFPAIDPKVFRGDVESFVEETSHRGD